MFSLNRGVSVTTDVAGCFSEMLQPFDDPETLVGNLLEEVSVN